MIRAKNVVISVCCMSLAIAVVYWSTADPDVPFETGQPFYAGWCEVALVKRGFGDTECVTFLYDSRLAIKLQYRGRQEWLADTDRRREWLHAMVSMVVEESSKQQWLSDVTRLLVLKGPGIDYHIDRTSLERLRSQFGVYGAYIPWPYISRVLDASGRLHRHKTRDGS